MKCAVTNCKSSNRNKNCKMHLFRFPTDVAIQKQWTSFCRRRERFNPKTSFICMLHFKTEDFDNTMEYDMGFSKNKRLIRGAVPSVNTSCPGNVQLYQDRADRLKKRGNRKTVALLLKESNPATCSQESKHSKSLGQTQEVKGSPIDDRKTFLSNLKEKSDEVDKNVSVEEETNSDYVESIKSEMKNLRKENKTLKKLSEKHEAEINKLKEEMANIRSLNREIAENSKNRKRKWKKTIT